MMPLDSQQKLLMEMNDSLTGISMVNRWPGKSLPIRWRYLQIHNYG